MSTRHSSTACGAESLGQRARRDARARRRGHGRRGAPTPGSGRAGPGAPSTATRCCAVEARRRRRHRARRHQAGDARRGPGGARAWRCAPPSSTSATSASTPAQETGGRPRARSAGRVRAGVRAPRPRARGRAGWRRRRPAASGTAMPGAPTATSCCPELGREADRLVVTEAVERDGAFGEAPEHVDDRLLLVRRVEIHEVRILHTDARAHLPGPARRRARGGHDARRGRARARRRRAPHLRRARPPCAGRGRRRSRRAAWRAATTSPRCSRTRSTPTSRCWRSAWLRVVEVPLNVAFTGRMLAYALDHADVTTLVVAPEFRDAVAAVEARPAAAGARVVELDDADARRSSTPARTDAASSSSGPEYRDVALADVHVGHHRAVEGGDHAVGGDVPVLVVGARRRARAGDGLYCAMPLFHNSGRSAFNYAMVRGRAVRDPRPVQRHRLLGRRPRRPAASTAALVGPMTALLHSAPPRDDDADNAAAQRDPRPDDPRHRGLRAALRRARRPPATARPRSAWPVDDRVGPRAVGQLRAHPRGLPVARGAHRRRARRAGGPTARWGSWSCAAPSRGRSTSATTRCRSRPPTAWRNGWFHTGDAFRRDDDGWYYFVDRLRDTIRRRGENISSFEVETLVVEHPGGASSARRSACRAPLGEDDVFVAVIVARPRRRSIPPRCSTFLEPRMPRFMLPALRRGGRRPPAHRGVDAGPQARAPRPRASPTPPGTARPPDLGRLPPARGANMCSCPARRRASEAPPSSTPTSTPSSPRSSSATTPRCGAGR